MLWKSLSYRRIKMLIEKNCGDCIRKGGIGKILVLHSTKMFPATPLTNNSRKCVNNRLEIKHHSSIKFKKSVENPLYS
jgi:hypothetical protein